MLEHAIAETPRQVVTVSAPLLQRCGDHACPPAGCHDREGEEARSSCGATPSVAPQIVHQVLRTAGESLPVPLRQLMSGMLGHDFSHVRIHTDALAAESAARVGATAFTVGKHVVLGQSVANPTTERARHVLAHELTHVLQQPALAPSEPLPISSPTDPAEREARYNADGMTTARATPRATAGLLVQRDDDKGAAAAKPNQAARQGVTSEKWSEELESQYRLRGDTRRAAAIRSCRENGGGSCGIVLTNAEMWSLYELSKHAGGNEEVVREGLVGAAPSLAFLGPLPSTPTLPPPAFAPPVVAPPVVAPPVVAPPVVAPGPAAGAGAGLGVEGAMTIGGIAAIVGICVIASIHLWELGRFQAELRRQGLIILEDPLAICIGGCHLPAAPTGRARPFPGLDAPPLNRDDLERWLERPPATRPTPAPAPEPAPRQGEDRRRPRPPFVLRLPQQKAPHLQRYRSWLGVLQSDPFYVRGAPAQLGKWHQAHRIGGSHGIPASQYERGHALGLTGEAGERRVRVPNWSRTRSTEMQVDHVVELQVTPPAMASEFNSVDNYELLDQASNGSSGPLLASNIARERAIQALFDPSSITRVLLFDSVEMDSGQPGERWSSDQVRRGEHLDVFPGN